MNRTNLRNKIRGSIAPAVAAGLVFAGSATNASAAYDMTGPIAEVALGVAAVALLGAALAGLSIVKRVWAKLGGK